MKKTLVTAAIAILLTPALAMAQKVSYDYDKTANFASFKTYAHKDGTKVGQPLIDDRIVAAIDAQLAAKGLTKDDANPDVVRRLSRRVRQAEGHLDLQQRLRRRLRGLRLGLGRRLGRRHDDHAGPGHPHRHARHRPRRREEEQARLARDGCEGSQHAGQS